MNLQMNADSIMLCLIDDCGDADIPLAEIACNGKLTFCIRKVTG